jgi:hypothetical protein|tara:strand:- start:50 stop:850 length:801 start_codon:yes stop_codon:yes gene_type:complete
MTLKKSRKERRKEYDKKRYPKIKEQQKEYQLKNREHIRERTAAYYLKNKEKIKEKRKKYYLKNPGIKKEHDKKYRLKNKEKIKEYHKEHYLKNKERILTRSRKYRINTEYDKKRYRKNKKQELKRSAEYRLKNSEKIKEYQKEYNSRLEVRIRTKARLKNKYHTDINFRLENLCRSRVYQALKFNHKSARTMELIGCTVGELRQHLESLFEPWMTWENQGRGGWDVDHIIACAKFDLTDPVQQRICFHWSNLQPLEHIANIKKGVG